MLSIRKLNNDWLYSCINLTVHGIRRAGRWPVAMLRKTVTPRSHHNERSVWTLHRTENVWRPKSDLARTRVLISRSCVGHWHRRSHTAHVDFVDNQNFHRMVTFGPNDSAVLVHRLSLNCHFTRMHMPIAYKWVIRRKINVTNCLWMEDPGKPFV